ncbi:hypothetical protein FOQG_17317 [Fusarium oxysporum f. sp. raphani 54005]|uniref:Heterokaryon incompatibility domain-containing protein n=1 Tax=Fusarium oxysporum f. sp. raphani 54005 TaxID=1089458 RepID=X0BGL3_FUSOX|nr:hypothetical protein FOQG_17317 [Fusarium oxysporum f. sp. raphani 54005]
MEEVFANARRVVVWLGDDTSNETRRAISTLKWGYPMFKVALSIWPLRHYILPYFNQVKLGFQKALWRVPGDVHDRECHAGLRQLLHHDWYRRIWTIQEVALARRILIVCGKSRITWPTFTRVLTTFDQAFSKPRIPYCVTAEGGYNPHHPVYHRVPFISRIQEIQVLRSWVSPSEKDKRRVNTRRRPPISLVINAILKGLNPHYSATIGLDRVYGMFGVLRGLGIELPAADYEKSLVEVVFQVLCQISRQYRSIQILQFVTGDHSLKGLPSWIPDYSIIPWSPTQFDQEVGTVEFDQKGTVLSVHGRRLDIVSAVSSTISHLDLHSSRIMESFDLSIPMFREKIRDWLKFIDATPTYQGWSQMNKTLHAFRLFIHPQRPQSFPPELELCWVSEGSIRSPAMGPRVCGPEEALPHSKWQDWDFLAYS